MGTLRRIYPEGSAEEIRQASRPIVPAVRVTNTEVLLQFGTLARSRVSVGLHLTQCYRGLCMRAVTVTNTVSGVLPTLVRQPSTGRVDVRQQSARSCTRDKPSKRSLQIWKKILDSFLIRTVSPSPVQERDPQCCGINGTVVHRRKHDAVSKIKGFGTNLMKDLAWFSLATRVEFRRLATGECA
jgi:hypothetical protein